MLGNASWCDVLTGVGGSGSPRRSTLLQRSGCYGAVVAIPRTRKPSGTPVSVPRVRLIVAKCEIDYRGRLATHLAEAVRLLIIKSDGTVMVWSDSGGQRVRPQNWMSPPTVVEEDGEGIVVRKLRGEE